MDYLNKALNGTVEKRFDISRFLAQREGTFDVAESYFLEMLPTLPALTQYKIVSLQYRLDMISYDIYGDTQYWWLLMYYNGEIDITAFPQGRVLNYFSLKSLDTLFYTLQQKSLPQPLRTPGS